MRAMTQAPRNLTGIVLVAALVAAPALAGCMDSFSSFSGDRGCTRSAPDGTAAAVNETDSGIVDQGGRVERIRTYEVDAAGTSRSAIDGCVSVGDVTVVPSSTALARIIITIRGPDAETVEEMDGKAGFSRDGDTLRATAWEVPYKLDRTRWNNGESPRVNIRIEVPDTGAHAVKARTDVGNIHVSDVLLAATDLRADVGDVVVEGAHATGNFDARVDVGRVDVRLGSAQTGHFDLRADVGDVELRIPSRADTGFDVEAEVDVGDVRVEIGATESRSEKGDGPGSTVKARSEGFADKPTQVTVEARADVGDVVVRAT